MLEFDLLTSQTDVFFSLDVKITFIFALYDKNSSHFLCPINSDYWNNLILTLYLLIPDWYGLYNSKRRYFNTTFYEEIPCRLVNTAVKILTHLSHSDLLEKKMSCTVSILPRSIKNENTFYKVL